MTDAAKPILYRAFLSYSHRDKRAAKRWHRRLEAFPIDRDLIGRATRLGPVPPKLSPIFWDRLDFPASGGLDALTRDHLDQSAALILLASPRSAASRAVNEEVRYFRHAYPDRPLVVILERGAGVAFRDCLPPALRFALDADGAVSTTPCDAGVAADPHDSDERPAGATAKVVAGLTGLTPKDVLSRAKKVLRRERWMWPGTVAGMSALLVMVAGGGWFVLDRIEQKQRDQTALSERQTADVLEDAAKKAAQAKVVADHHAAEAKTADAVRDAKLERILAETQREKGVPLPVLQAILARFGNDEALADPSRAEQMLHTKADEYVALQGRLSRLTDDDPRVQAWRQQAAILVGAGQFDDADKVLAEAERHDLEAVDELETRASGRRRSAAATRADRAAAARVRLDYRGAAAHYAEAAAIVANADTGALWRYTLEAAGSLSNQGEEFGDRPALIEATQRYEAALLLAPRDRAPLDWATTQDALGVALRRLGDREAERTRLDQAVETFRAAMTERTRERAPLDWAMTQKNLGRALRSLGERESGAASLERSVDAYRAALIEWTRDRMPLDWASAQLGLCDALTLLGERESGVERLVQAVEACRATLLELTRDRMPLQWAATQNSLGCLLAALGGQEDGVTRLDQAVVAYRAALSELTRNRVPLYWAMAQQNLGNALVTLGEQESGTARLDQAVDAFRAALQELTRDRAPLQWAVVQSNLGSALRTLAERESGTARLDQAVEAYRAALQEMSRDRVPLDWAATRYHLGLSLAVLAKQRRERVLMGEAIACLNDAADVYRETRDQVWLPQVENAIVATWGTLMTMPR